HCRSLTVSADEPEKVAPRVSLDRIVSQLENDPISGKTTCAFYIQKLCGCGDLLYVAKLLSILREKGMYLSPSIYHIVMTAAGEKSDFEFVSRVFKDLLLSCGYSLPQTSYSILAKAFLSSTDAIHLLNFVREVSELVPPKNATFINKIIYGFAVSRQIDKGLLIFHHIKNLKCKQDIFTYNIVLDILGRAGRIDEMLHVFDSMNEMANVVPDTVTYNTVINSLRTTRRLDLCLFFTKEMGDKGLEPDLRTYSSLIESFGRSGRVEEAMKLLEEMKKREIRPSIYIYRALISNLKKVGKLNLAASLSDEMNSCISDLVSSKDFKGKIR
ncbi:hypothetical protein GIB67_009503, partial [Kingdonia uniflora]